MKLDRVEIKNFRSIDTLRLPFKHGCQALIGINESGKSNILRALHLLDPAVAVTRSDLRIERHDEPQVKDGHVLFVFRLDEPDIASLEKVTLAHFCEQSVDEPLVSDGLTVRNLRDYCRSIGEVLFRASLPSGTRTPTTWARPSSEVIADGWYRNKTSGPIVLPRSGEDPWTVPASGFVRFPADASPDPATFSKASAKDIETLHRTAVQLLVNEQLPKCIFWKYADQYLLPTSVDVAAFCANPDSCIPLKSMFELAGYNSKTLGATLTDAQAQGHYRYVQILEKAAARASEHIRQVWKDYKGVRIKLESHGATLSPIVVDNVVPLDMANRSDGFKRFVSFLLQISAKVRTEELAGSLILIDEPEIALHPSGAKNLMRELIEIGKSNTIVYSTHSIFMVDKMEIDRHLIVEKKSEVTTTWRAEKSRIQDEEVLYSAMGFSVFEALKECNVIFEGWRDKEIFRVVADAMSKANPATKSRLSEIGMTYAEGVKDVRNVAHFLQLASRPCLILSDADKVAIQHQKAYQTPGAWGVWKTLKDVLPGTSAVTGEDFVVRAAVVKRLNRFRVALPALPALTEEFFNAGESTASGVRRWLVAADTNPAEVEEVLSRAKDAIFEGLKRNEVSDEAEQLVQFVVGYDFGQAPAPEGGGNH